MEHSYLGPHPPSNTKFLAKVTTLRFLQHDLLSIISDSQSHILPHQPTLACPSAPVSLAMQGPHPSHNALHCPTHSTLQDQMTVLVI